MLNQPQMFPSEWKMMIYGSHCKTETTPPTCHTHRTHPPATPTCHTHPPAIPIDTPTCYTLQPLPLVLWLMCVVDVCVRWACQVDVSGGRVWWVWHTYLTHPPDTPTCYSSSHFHVSMLLMCQVGVWGGRVRWVCQVGVSDCQVGVFSKSGELFNFGHIFSREPALNSKLTG